MYDHTGGKSTRARYQAPAHLLGKHQGGAKQGERGPPGDDLVPVEPHPVGREQETGDGADP